MTVRMGEGPESCRWHSPEERLFREHVNANNRRYGVEMIK
jgi:hypothetical protein